MRTLWAVVLCSIGWAVSAQVGLSTSGPRVVMPVVEPSVRAALEAAWDEKNPKQTERGYCAAARVFTHVTPVGSAAIVLDSLVKPDSVRHPTPVSIQVYCRLETVPIHVHTPTTCERDSTEAAIVATCEMGGVEAWECMPSESDYGFMFGQHVGVAAIQCDRHALFFYFDPRFFAALVK